MSDPAVYVPRQKPAEGRLDSWKEIAAYLNRDVTTVQRWEKRESMPVHRHLHDKRGSVYALSTELDAWMLSRKAECDEDDAAVGTVQETSEAPVGSHRSAARWFVLVPVAVILLAAGTGIWLNQRGSSWRDPIAAASFQTLTDFDRVQGAAAVSRDGQFVAFLSDRDGQTDVWVTQVGSGQFHNLTQGNWKELQNRSVRTLGFSPDGSMVTFWARAGSGSAANIGIWAVPTLGGDVKQYLDGVAEYDWSRDGSRLAYHTADPGDPLFISDGSRRADERPLYKARAGVHCHFPIWSPDGRYIYFAMGELPEDWDIWRIPASGGNPERITSQASLITYPVLLNRHTLLYLANDSDGAGPWLYSVDVDQRVPHRLTYGIERYTSLASTVDGRRLVATLAVPKMTLWRLTIPDSPKADLEPAPMQIPTSNGFYPRLGPGYLLYVSSSGSSEGIWKMSGGTGTELWSGEGAHLQGAPAISGDGAAIAFSVRQKGKAILYAMQSDGTGLRVISDSLDLRGAPAWTPDNQAITIAVVENNAPRLYRISADGRSSVPLMREYSSDAAWSSDGSFFLYSGPDVGTQFSLRAANADGTVRSLPSMSLTRGSRHFVVLSGGRAFAILKGDLQHKNVWLFDPGTGTERQLTNLAPDFNLTGFDVSRDGRQVVLERTEESSQIVLLDLAKE